MTLNINIETKHVIKIFALAALFTVGIFSLGKMYNALILVSIAFFIALALNPAVSFFARHLPGNRRGPAIAIVLVIAITLVGSLVAATVQPVAKETSSFAKTLPSNLNDLRYRNQTVRKFVDRYELDDNIDSIAASSKERASSFGKSALSSAGKVGNSLLNTLTVLVIAVLMLAGGPKLANRFSERFYLDDELRDRHEKLVSKMYRVVTGYINGQVLIALVASLFALGTLSVLRIPYPVPLAAIVFVFGLVPLIGNTLAAIVVVLATLVLKDVTAAAILLGFFVLYQQVENISLQPLIQGRTTQLPALVIFISVILGVALLGPIGGLFAIPAAGCAKILFIDYLDHRDSPHLGDSPKTLFDKVKHRVKSVGKN